MSQTNIFESVEFISSINEQIFLRYKKGSSEIHREARRIAQLFSTPEEISVPGSDHDKYGLTINRVEYDDAGGLFFAKHKFTIKVHYDYTSTLRSEDIEYDIIESLMDHMIKKSGYKKYGSRYAIRRDHGCIYALDYTDVYQEEEDYDVTTGTDNDGIISAHTNHIHQDEEQYILVTIKCLEDTPGNLAILRR